MMSLLVWGAPDLPEIHGDHQGVERWVLGGSESRRCSLRSRQRLTLVGLGSARRVGRGRRPRRDRQPARQTAGVDELITGSGFDPTGGDAGFVQVQVTETVLVPDIEGEGFHEETGPGRGRRGDLRALPSGAGLATTDELDRGVAVHQRRRDRDVRPGRGQ